MSPKNGDGGSRKEHKKKSRRRSPSQSDRSSRSSSRERRPKRRERSRTPEKRRESRTRSRSPQDSKRLHIGNLDDSIRRRDIEDTFGKYGKLADVWLASYPPYYAFVAYNRGEEAAEALKDMRSGYIRDCHVRTTVALPRHNVRRAPPPRRRRSVSRSVSPVRKNSRRSRSPSPKKRKNNQHRESRSRSSS